MPDIAKQVSRYIAGLLVIALSILVLSPHRASAAVQGVSIAPTVKDITISSGLIKATTNVTVTNSSTSSITASIKLVDFKAQGDFGGIALGQAGLPTGKYGLAKWMTLPGGDKLSLAAGQSSIISVNVDNRSDLAPGGHYGAIIVTVNESNSANGSKVTFKQQLVSLLFAKKLGGEKFGLELQSLQPNKSQAIPETVSLKFESTGNVYVVPRGYLEVTNPKKAVIAKGIINPESTLVLPETTRQFSTTLNSIAKSDIPGTYTVTAYYRYDGKNSFATKSIEYTTQKYSKTVVVASILTGVIVLLVLIKILRNRRK